MNNVAEKEKKPLDEGSLLVDKIDCLRMLLQLEIADMGINYTVGMDIPYIPYFKDSEQKVITKKIFELIEKL